jgi:hypothetical protein
MAKVTRELWRGVVAYEEDDTPSDVRLSIRSENLLICGCSNLVSCTDRLFC